jgi:hypothetical protein
MAKIEELGLGFGAGAKTFRLVAKQLSGGTVDLKPIMRHATQEEVDAMAEGTWVLDDEGYPIIMESDPAQESVDTWRARYPEIVEGWAKCGQALPFIAAGREMAIDPWGLCHTVKDGIRLPGYTIRYPDLRQEKNEETGRKEWVYGWARHKAKIYGAKMVENIVQSLARQTIMDYTIDYFKLTGLRPALRPYDELVYVVDAYMDEELLAALQSVMRVPPKWWPELTVWSAGSVGKTYGEAK